MKIPSLGLKGVLHCLGRGKDHAESLPAKPGNVTGNPLDVLSRKARNSGGRSTAQRIRRHFIALAEKSMKSAEAGNTEAKRLMQALPGDARWAGKNEEVANEALKVVRLALYNKKYGSHKSSNKFKTTAFAAEINRVTSGKFFDFINAASSIGPSHMTAMLSRGIWNSTSINCDGLALSAMDFISHAHPNVQVSSVELPGHRLAVVGTIDAKCIRSPLSEWPSHLYICDPWANIVCPAPEYPERFAKKMEKWESEHKKISSDGEWISPTNEKWVSCTKEVPKISTRITYKAHQFVDMTYVAAPAGSPTTDETGAVPGDSGKISPSTNR